MDKEDVVHIYTTEYYSAIKKNERKGICSNEDYYNKFSEHSSSHMDTNLKKYLKNAFLW